MIIITGSGRSGTSILTYILFKLGCDFGKTQMNFSRIKNAGCETHEIVIINRKIVPRVNSAHQDTWLSPRKRAERMSPHKETMIKLSKSIKFVKDPRFSKTLESWIMAGANIDLVIICLRDPWDVAKSAKRTGGAISKRFSVHEGHQEALARIGNLYYLLKKYNIPFVEVMYPDDYLVKEPLEKLANTLNIDKNKMFITVKENFKPLTKEQRKELYERRI